MMQEIIEKYNKGIEAKEKKLELLKRDKNSFALLDFKEGIDRASQSCRQLFKCNLIKTSLDFSDYSVEYPNILLETHLYDEIFHLACGRTIDVFYHSFYQECRGENDRLNFHIEEIQFDEKYIIERVFYAIQNALWKNTEDIFPQIKSLLYFFKSFPSSYIETVDVSEKSIAFKIKSVDKKHQFSEFTNTVQLVNTPHIDDERIFTITSPALPEKGWTDGLYVYCCKQSQTIENTKNTNILNIRNISDEWRTIYHKISRTISFALLEKILK